MSNNEKYCIIYHREDNDGLFSMAIIYNYLVNELKVDCNEINLVEPDFDYVKDAVDHDKSIVLIGADYDQMKRMSTVIVFDVNDDDIDVKYEEDTLIDKIVKWFDHIIMTDISFADIYVMKDIYEKKGEKFTWIDHHAPIINQSIRDGLEGIPGEKNTTVSAILNAYRYFYDPFDTKHINKSEDIELFRLLSAWDSFSFGREGYDQDYVLNVNTGVTNKFGLDALQIIPYVQKLLYEGTNFSDISEFYHEGAKLNKQKDEHNERILKECGAEWMIGDSGRCGIALFVQGGSSSIMFKSVKDKYKHGIVFKRLKNGNWVLSLYNTDTKYDNEFHCGNYLREKYGGGGHPGAAGCQLTEEQFVEILKHKKI